MIINRLLSVLNQTDLTSPSHAIAKNILVCIKKEKEINITKIASMSGTSKAMVSKFSRQLGYDQFKDLKEDCHFISFRKENSLPLKQYFTHHELLDLENIAHHMGLAHCIYLYGCGYNYILAMQLQYLLLDLDLPVVIMDELLSRQYQIKDKSMLLVIDLNKDTSLRIIKKRYEDFYFVDLLQSQTSSYLKDHVYIELLSKLVHKL